MADTKTFLVCGSCGAVNRIPVSARGKTPKCGKCHSPMEPGEPQLLTDSNFDSVVASDIPVVVDFWAPWCAPCRMVAPALEDLARRYQWRLVVGKLNVDDNPDVARRFRVTGIPTLAVFRNGKEIDRVVGALPKPQLEHFIQRHLP